MKTKTYAEFTDYPKIFSKCYWGRFRENVGEITQIIENRNRFVSEFRIKKYVNGYPPQNALSLFDHCELYKCDEGFVYIVSPCSEIEDDILEKFGLSKYHPLYLNEAYTYLKIFETKIEFNRYLKEATKLSEINKTGI